MCSSSFVWSEGHDPARRLICATLYWMLRWAFSNILVSPMLSFGNNGKIVALYEIVPLVLPCRPGLMRCKKDMRHLEPFQIIGVTRKRFPGIDLVTWTNVDNRGQNVCRDTRVQALPN